MWLKPISAAQKKMTYEFLSVLRNGKVHRVYFRSYYGVYGNVAYFPDTLDENGEMLYINEDHTVSRGKFPDEETVHIRSSPYFSIVEMFDNLETWYGIFIEAISYSKLDGFYESIGSCRFNAIYRKYKNRDIPHELLFKMTSLYCGWTIPTESQIKDLDDKIAMFQESEKEV